MNIALHYNNNKPNLKKEDVLLLKSITCKYVTYSERTSTLTLKMKDKNEEIGKQELLQRMERGESLKTILGGALKKVALNWGNIDASLIKAAHMVI